MPEIYVSPYVWREYSRVYLVWLPCVLSLLIVYVEEMASNNVAVYTEVMHTRSHTPSWYPVDPPHACGKWLSNTNTPTSLLLRCLHESRLP